MKKLVVLLAVVLLGTTFAMAQNREGQRNMNPEEMAKKRTEELKKELKLDRVQTDKMEKFLTASNKEMMELRKELQNEEDRFKIRDKMNEFRKTQDEGIKKILKPEQVEKYEKLMQERQERRGRGPGERR
ncbi:hypothetical protein [uncultured Draconibacterium sp.]|uniref:hypothetical protein n=1 Tax=uncultured Draconibacterium sp. TaxID=1573823 RepID=UPI0025D78459|nr:hypothetical protein [uncultured Draconibacterium sp.]